MSCRWMTLPAWHASSMECCAKVDPRGILCLREAEVTWLTSVKSRMVLPSGFFSFTETKNAPRRARLEESILSGSILFQLFISQANVLFGDELATVFGVQAIV